MTPRSAEGSCLRPGIRLRDSAAIAGRGGRGGAVAAAAEVVLAAAGVAAAVADARGGGGGMPRRRGRWGFLSKPWRSAAPAGSAARSWPAVPAGAPRRYPRASAGVGRPASGARRRAPLDSSRPVPGRAIARASAGSPASAIGRRGGGTARHRQSPRRGRRRRRIGNRPGIDNRPGGVGGAAASATARASTTARAIGNRPGIDNRPRRRQRRRIGNRPGIDNRPGSDKRSAASATAPASTTGRSPGAATRSIAGDDQPVGGIRRTTWPDRLSTRVTGSPARLQRLAGRVLGLSPGMGQRLLARLPRQQHLGMGPFAAGAATGVTAWALGSSFYNWGYASYANPYYAEATVAQPIVIEQTIAGGEPQTVSVPASPMTTASRSTRRRPRPLRRSPIPPSRSSTRPVQAFRSGDYAGALQLTDEALKVLQNDATLHEFRALVLFAVGKYDLAAGPLYAVLSVGPGWDWTTMVGLYPSIDVYTAQLRKLEAFISANPTSTSARFVLAYHYLTQGHIDAAVGQLKQVVALAPEDTLSAQLVKQFSPAGNGTGDCGGQRPLRPRWRQPAKPGKLAGKWTANPARDTTIAIGGRGRRGLHLEGRLQGQAQQLSGKWSLTDNLLTLAQEGDAGALVGRVAWQADDKWSFRVIGTGAEDQGLLFTH